MSCDIEAAAPEGPVYRLGRAPDPWDWPDWAYAGTDGTFGNRYDDPRGEYRVLYASSERLGAFVETLARFRTDPVLVEALEEIEDGGEEDAVAAGVVPVGWLAGRALGTARLTGQYAAVGQSGSLAYLREALGGLAIELGIAELDGAAIRLRVPRAFTQAVSRLVFECQTDIAPQFRGIHYLSRLGDDIYNWAIFEPPAGTAPPITDSERASLERSDPDLAAALEHLGLRLVA